MAETPIERRSSGLHLELIPIDPALLEKMAKVREKSTLDTSAYEAGTGSPVDNFRSYNQHTPPQGAGYVDSARYGFYAGFIPHTATVGKAVSRLGYEERGKPRGMNPAGE